MLIRSFDTLTVRQFFSTVNWDDRSSQRINQTDPEIIDEQSSLGLTVGEFFAAVNWDGGAIANRLALPTTQSKPSKTNQITLDQFSDLF
jgi:hypothetical protein